MAEEEKEERAQEEGQGKSLPENFSYRLAERIGVYISSDRNLSVVLENLAAFLGRNILDAPRIRSFLHAIELLLEVEEQRGFAAYALVAIFREAPMSDVHAQMVSNLGDILIQDHMEGEQAEVYLELSKKSFSGITAIIAEAMIALIEVRSEYYEVISYYFTMILEKEVAMEISDKGQHTSQSSKRKKQAEASPSMNKKLFDEIIDYMSARAEFVSESLNQKNPNEYINLLADRLRGTRRYLVQEILRKHQESRRKEAEKELSERLAGAEELVLAREHFQEGLRLFWSEKVYNYKYVSIEKVRITAKIFGVLLGMAYFLVGYLNFGGVLWWEGLIVGALTGGYSMFRCSKKAFRGYFPKDVSAGLEEKITLLAPIIKRVSKKQFQQFLFVQIQDPRNYTLLGMFQEFLRYLFWVIPDKSSILLKREEIVELLEEIDLEMGRVIRKKEKTKYRNM